jgi:hypothetical protein
LVEKPPVERVVKEWHTASKRFSLQCTPTVTGTHQENRAINTPICTRVRSAYKRQSTMLVSVILGRRPSAEWPGTSVRNMCFPDTPRLGNTAMNNTTMPIPPNHWIRDLHKSTGRDRLPSMSSTTVAPVVVKPLTASKTASGNAMRVSIRNGSAPHTPVSAQTKVVVSVASIRRIFTPAAGAPHRIIKPPNAAVIPADSSISNAL